MQSKGGREKDYAGFINGKLTFSSIEYLREVVRKNNDIELEIPDTFCTISLPFCTAFFVLLEEFVGYLYFNSNAHRRLIESKEFAELSKPCVRYVTNNPVNAKGKIEFDLWDNDFWPLVYWRLFEVHAPLESNLTKSILKPKKEDSILEIGCATGNLSTRLARDVKNITGMDKSQFFINRAKKRAQRLGLKNCEFINAGYPCDLRRQFDYTIAFNTPFSEKEYYGHVFPSNEVLLVGFVNTDQEYNKETLRKIYRGLSNFEKKYIVKETKETWEEFGDNLYILIQHLIRK